MLLAGGVVVAAVVTSGWSTAALTIPAAATTASSKPSPGCKTRPAVAPGDSQVGLDADGVDGFYLRHVPPSYRAGRALPLVVDLHGYAESAPVEAQMTQLGRYGDTHGFVTLTPQGQGPVPLWNTTLGSGDLRFIGSLLDEAERTLCINEQRVYVTGLSDGAFMTSAVACAYAKRVAAVAPVAGIQDTSGCRPARPVPVVTFHGTADPFVAFNGGLGPKALALPAPDGSPRTLGQLGAAASTTPGPSIPQIIAVWAKRNGCAAKPESTAVASDVTHIHYRCPDHADVDFYRVAGGGHAWPGSTLSRAIASVIGPTTFSISADTMLWRFFQAHPLH
jgi:polyhydroxybutyrate depolymerase